MGNPFGNGAVTFCGLYHIYDYMLMISFWLCTSESWQHNDQCASVHNALQCTWSIPQQSPQMGYAVLHGGSKVTQPNGNRSLHCSLFPIRPQLPPPPTPPQSKDLLVPGYEEKIHNGAKCRCLQGGNCFSLGTALCSIVVFTLSSSPELENPHC